MPVFPKLSSTIAVKIQLVPVIVRNGESAEKTAQDSTGLISCNSNMNEEILFPMTVQSGPTNRIPITDVKVIVITGIKNVRNVL